MTAPIVTDIHNDIPKPPNNDLLRIVGIVLTFVLVMYVAKLITEHFNSNTTEQINKLQSANDSLITNWRSAQTQNIYYQSQHLIDSQAIEAAESESDSAYFLIDNYLLHDKKVISDIRSINADSLHKLRAVELARFRNSHK